jgi:hypothetical protein
MPRSKALLMLALGSATGGALRAQEAEAVRRPTFVRVVDARGEPLANATVWLSGGQPHLGAVVGALDALVVASDARGRAQAKLLPGLCYVAWAAGPADDQGGGVASAPTGYFGAGSLFELRCAMPYQPRRITIAGVDAWQHNGPLRYFVMTPYPGAEEELLADDAGRLPMPPWPQAIVEVRTADGQPLWSSSAADQLKIPPPREVAVRVVDEKGAALAGAAIRLRVARQRPWNVDGLGGVVDGRFRDLAVTPASGRITVQVPYPSEPLAEQMGVELLLFASVRGRPAVAGGVFGKALYQDERKVAAVADGELVFTLKPVEPLVGRCRTVPPGTTAHLAAVCKLFSDRNSYSHDARSFVATVGEDGTFVFDDVPAELHSCRLTLLLPERRAGTPPLFQAMAGRELPPQVTPVAGRAAPIAATNVTALRLRVTDPEGGPARGVVAFLVPFDLNGVLLRDSLVRVPLDAAGVATVAIVQGSWIVMVQSAAGYAATKAEVGSPEMEVPLAMQPLATMKVRLLDANGEPIAGARVLTKSSSTRSSGDPVEAMLQSIQQQARSAWSTLVTDARGTVTIPFMPVKGVTNRIVLSWESGSTDPFVLEANDAPLELRAK